LSYLH